MQQSVEADFPARRRAAISGAGSSTLPKAARPGVLRSGPAVAKLGSIAPGRE